jgi:hypothetical protein
MMFRLKIVCFLFVSIISYSQIENLQNFDKKTVHFGYYLGINQYNFKLDYKENPSKGIFINQKIGLNIGLIGDLRLKKNLNLRFEPGLYTNKLNIVFYERSRISTLSDALRTIKSTYIHLPLLLKYSANRYKNIRPYITGGISTSFNLSSDQNKTEDNSSGVFRTKTNNVYYEMGLGIDIYFQNFKFSPSLRGLFSLKNELVPDEDPNSPWTGNIKKMSTKGVFLNFSFH